MIPPLRDRGEDAILLAKYLAERFAVEQKKRPPRLSQEAAQAIRRHPWRGNVRELENRVRRAVVLNESGTITAADLDLPETETARDDAGRVMSLRQARDAAERRAIGAALEEAGGNLSATAKLLGVSRPTLYALLRQHGFGPPNRAEDETALSGSARRVGIRE